MVTTKATFRPTIRLTDTEGVYRIASKTYAGEFYTTDVRNPARPACDCFAGQDNFRGCKRDSVCWHVRAAEAFRAEVALWELRTERAARQSVAAPPALQPALIA